MLTPKQLRFCEEYIIDLNAFQAAEEVGICLFQMAKRYYVYFLINPVDSSIFYVGKGKGDRKEQHLKLYLKNKKDNAFKQKVIADIVEQGRKPEAVIFANDLDEYEALQIEASLIKSFSARGLTNIFPGKISQIEKSKVAAQVNLSMILPFEEWCRRRNPSDAEKEIYYFVKDSLETIALEGCITKIIHVHSEEGNKLYYE